MDEKIWSDAQVVSVTAEPLDYLDSPFLVISSSLSLSLSPSRCWLAATSARGFMELAAASAAVAGPKDLLIVIIFLLHYPF